MIWADEFGRLCLQVKENNYRGHGDSVDQLCWHPTNPDLFVTASGDKTIRIWDVRTTKCMATVNTKGWDLRSCAGWAMRGWEIIRIMKSFLHTERRWFERSEM